MTLEQRVETLERRNRQLLVIVAITIGLAVLGGAGVRLPWAWAQEAGKAPAVADVVRAHGFELVDDKGKIRAMLSVDDDAPSLILFDDKGKIRAMLGLVDDWPTLSLFDAKGMTRAWLDVDSNGPALGMYDEKGATRAMLDVDSNGPALDLYDAQGRERLQLREREGPALILRDEKGEPIWSAPR